MAPRSPFTIMGVVNWLRLTVFFAILILGLIVLGLTAHFAEILVPSDLTRFVTVGLIVSIITLLVTTAVFLLGIFRTYIYAAQTRVELAWLGVLSVLWMALAIFLSMSADVEIDCAEGGGAIEENLSVGMTSDEFEAEYRAMQACSFINAILLAAWFLLLLSFTVAHHFSGYDHVWRTPVADYAWLDNPVGARQRQKAKVNKALGGMSSETSLSSEEEIRGRARTRNRVRERSREAIREKAGLPVTFFRPFYDLPKPAVNRPKPVRAATQPIQSVSVPVQKPMPPVPPRLIIPGATTAYRTAPSPVRPGPPVRTNSVPQPVRLPTPPPATPLSRNVSGKSAQTFMTARTTQSNRTPITPTQSGRTPVTQSQPARTPITSSQPARTPITPSQPARTPITPSQPARTPITPSQPIRAPSQPVRSSSQSGIPRAPIPPTTSSRPVPVRTASTPQASRPVPTTTAAPPTRPAVPSGSSRPPAILTASSSGPPPRAAQAGITSQSARPPPTSLPIRSQSATGLTRTPTPVRGPATRQRTTSGSRPIPVRTPTTQPNPGAPPAARPQITRAQTAAVAQMQSKSPITPTAPRPAASRSQTYWQPPPGTKGGLDVPLVVGNDGLRNRSRSRDGRMV